MLTTHTERVAATVRAEMARQRITQTQMAERLGMSQVAVSRRLLGQVPFDVEELGRVAEILDLPASVLFGGEAA
jgi:transcriptional regulator with XRE-family HTH domain